MGVIMNKKTAFILSFCLFFLHVIAIPSQSCVGRILTVSTNESIEQKLMGQLLATYITERTGTTVNIITAADVDVCEEQIKQCKADIFINYLNVGLANIYGTAAAGEDQEKYGLVKQHYIETFDMVWLKPLGYKGPVINDNGEESSQVSLAIPVTTREVLNRFPVLDRVVNKLGGRIDRRTLQRLIEAAKTDEPESVVRKFLKDQNLI